MLIKCKECELQVSDKAVVCPHCGYPLLKTKHHISNPNKRKRLPNGFGQISEMKGHNIRNKFRAMVTVGKDSNGKYIVKPLKPQSHFATYNEAYAALLEYNKNPYDLNDTLTVKETYDKWTEEYFQKIKNNSTRTIKSAWSYCSSIYDMRISDVRARHIKGCMENGTANIKGVIKSPSPETKSRIKSMFNLLLDYALEYELVDRNYARTFVLDDEIIEEKNKNSKNHIPFTDKELDTLWENINLKNNVDVILFQCYSGLRPQEIGLIELNDVNIKDDTFVCGLKTEAGKNRLVPIHPKIKFIVEAKYKEAIELGSNYLFNCTDTNTARSSLFFSYDKYQKRFKKVISELNLNDEHRAHDGRKTFVTKAKKYKLDEYAIKYIVGHKIEDITERVYTDREVQWLKDEIKKIK